jgi:hypothetical protein
LGWEIVALGPEARVSFSRVRIATVILSRNKTELAPVCFDSGACELAGLSLESDSNAGEAQPTKNRAKDKINVLRIGDFVGDSVGRP